jgi:hypothetical protein
MNKLLYIRPIKFFLIHIAAIALSISIFIAWGQLVPDTLISFGFVFVIIGIIGGFQFWIYLLFKGFNIVDSKNGLESNLKKSKIHLIAILAGYIIFVLVFMLDFAQEDFVVPMLISIFIGAILTLSFFHIVIQLTKKFKFYDNKPQPNLWDYFITLFTLTFYPFGIVMLHSHLQLILKEQKIIKD